MPVEAFSRIANLLSEPMLLVCVDGGIKGANASAGELLGRPVGALIGAALTDQVADGAGAVRTFLVACSRSTSMRPGTLTAISEHGGKRVCRVHGALFQNASKAQPAIVILRLTRNEVANRFVELNRRIEALSREMLRRSQAEAALAAQERLLRVTLASIGDAVITTDAQGLVTFMNGVAETRTGWAAGEAIGRPLEEVFAIVNEDSDEPVENPVGKVLGSGRVVGLANHTVLIRKDGGRLPIDDAAAPIRDEGGPVLGVVLVFRDVTQRRALERDIQQQAQRLVELDRRKDEFLAMLSHELRNPLTPIRNGVRILQSEAPKCGPVQAPVLEKVTAMMERQVGQLTRLVDDLLDVARITRGQIPMEMRPIALEAALERAVETVRPIAESRQQALDVQLPPASVTVKADLERLSQAFLNLLSNAVKFTEPGGKITVVAELREDRASVRVIDTGIGMPADLIPKIFELFTQGDTSLARPMSGLGVGLSLVKGLVEMHGGQVEAFSAGPGKGSEFVVHLPAYSAPVPRKPLTTSRQPVLPSSPEKSILIVDDNVDGAETLAVLLSASNHVVQTAKDAIDALHRLSSFNPAIILLDIGLPGMDGYALARQLRTRPDTRNALLIAITGYGQDSDRARSREAGFDYHLTKPVNIEVLQTLLAGKKA